ncbi:hypothetical protein TNCV_3660271 [Trichonephila clavipes]|nr:hypothetical protein TNCV_3660271 [Trichonephila clavipes]
MADGRPNNGRDEADEQLNQFRNRQKVLINVAIRIYMRVGSDETVLFRTILKFDAFCFRSLILSLWRYLGGSKNDNRCYTFSTTRGANCGSYGWTVTLRRIPSYVGIPGNAKADQKAKQGAWSSQPEVPLTLR